MTAFWCHGAGSRHAAAAESSEVHSLREFAEKALAHGRMIARRGRASSKSICAISNRAKRLALCAGPQAFGNRPQSRLAVGIGELHQPA
jgi:hypothetical protein